MYMIWNPVFVIVLVGVCLLTYYAGIVAEKGISIAGHRLLICLIILAFTPLLAFKYWNFFSSIINDIAVNRIHVPGLNWAVPIGISFYTFQSVGYVLDVKRGKIRAEMNLLDYSLFVSFFPQVMCGPISKGDELIPQLKNPGNFNRELATNGFHLLIWGMFMKFVVADRLGMLVDTVYSSPGQYSGANILATSFLYSFQIYGDFAGYSFMAVGISGLLGIRLINNFCRPYLAITVTDFWRRWHISLTRWLKENIYIQLGGNRKGKRRTYLNILMTFLVSGIWHGAAWTFIIWGVFHGLVQCLERMTGISKVKEVSVIRRIAMTLCCFISVSILWILFRAPSFSDVTLIFNQFFTSFGKLDLHFMGTDYLFNVLLVLPIVFIKDLYDEFIRQKRPINLFESELFRWGLSALAFAIVLAFGVLDSTQFIYSGF